MTQNATPGSMGNAPDGSDDASARVGAEGGVKGAGDAFDIMAAATGVTPEELANAPIDQKYKRPMWSACRPVSPRWVDMTGPVTVNLDRPSVAWIDDPWYDLRPEQAWRAGWEAAKAQAVTIATPPQGRLLPAEYYDAREQIADAIAAMDPPS
jgi:hypothetical protein